MKSDTSLILSAFEKFHAFLILGHEEPDGDSVGSSLALASFLKRAGKQVFLCSPEGPFQKNEIKSYRSCFQTELPDLTVPGLVLVLVDCSSPFRTGFDGEALSKLPLIVIDHHANGHGLGDYQYVDPELPSTTLLIQNILEAGPGEITEEEAELIFFGFCTDTDFFRFVDKRIEDVFSHMGRLASKGISPSLMKRRIEPVYSHDSIILAGDILRHSETFFQNRVIFAHDSYRDRKHLNIDSTKRNSALLYQLLMAVEGVQIVVLIKEEQDKVCYVGMRSKDQIDIGVIAQGFGGGGHKNAAGFQTNKKVSEIKNELLNEIRKLCRF